MQKDRFEIVSDIRGLLLDIFFAGLDSTLTAMLNSFPLFFVNPECKTKICTEIDRVNGKVRHQK